MRSWSTATCMAAFVMVAVGCQAPPPQFTAQDEAILRGMFDATPGYIRAGDWTTWAGQYSQDGLLHPANGPAVSGRASILAWGQAFPKVEDLTFSNVRVWGEGNVAYGTSTYVLKLIGLPPDTGKQLVVFRRPPAGKWEVVAVSVNSDLPVAGQSHSTSAPTK